MADTKKGRPVSMSFFDIFVAPRPRKGGILPSGTVCRDASGRPVLVRTRKKSSKKTASSPTGSTNSEAPGPPNGGMPPNSGDLPALEASVNTWTFIEDNALLGMKVQKKSWEEINEQFAGKDLEAVKERYRTLYGEAPAEAKEKGADAQDGRHGNNEKGKEGEAKEGEAKGNDGGKKGKERRKASEEAKKGTKTPTSNKGKEKEEVDEDLSPEDITRLQHMKSRYDERKWVELSSRFFDMFGKRFDPEILKEKLK